VSIQAPENPYPNPRTNFQAMSNIPLEHRAGLCSALNTAFGGAGQERTFDLNQIQSSTLVLSPNPAKDGNFKIEEISQTGAQVWGFSSSGKLVLEMSYQPGTTITLQSSGLYFVEYQDDAGRKSDRIISIK